MFDRDDAPKVLNEEQLQTIHDQAMRILTEIGTDVLHEPARDALAAATRTGRATHRRPRSRSRRAIPSARS